MKNMLFVAGMATLLFAAFLVWMDNVLANHLDQHPLHPAPQEPVYPITLPEVRVYPAPDNTPTAALPEVVVRTTRSRQPHQVYIP